MFPSPNGFFNVIKERIFCGHSNSQPSLCSLNYQLFGFTQGQPPVRQFLFLFEILISHVSDLELGGVVFRGVFSLNLQDPWDLFDMWSGDPTELANYRSVLERF